MGILNEAEYYDLRTRHVFMNLLGSVCGIAFKAPYLPYLDPDPLIITVSQG
jgi:hypothetical protein